MPTSENIEGSLAAAIIAAGYEPRTVDEWIISAMNFFHNEGTTPDGSLYVYKDGTTPITGQQEFELGLLVSGGSIDGDPVSGLGINPGPLFTIIGTALLHYGTNFTWGDGLAVGNGTLLELDDSAESFVFTGVTHFRPGLADHIDNAAALAAGLSPGDLYRTAGAVMVVT